MHQRLWSWLTVGYSCDLERCASSYLKVVLFYCRSVHNWLLWHIYRCYMSPRIIFSLAALGFGGDLSQLFFCQYSLHHTETRQIQYCDTSKQDKFTPFSTVMKPVPNRSCFCLATVFFVSQRENESPLLVVDAMKLFYSQSILRRPIHKIVI